MGNENSKSKELTKNGKIPEKHENGSVNGVPANITSNRLDFNGETVVKKNGGPLSLNYAIESTDHTDCVVIEAVAQKAEAPVISETPETPAAPETPETTETPATPEKPETTETPEKPETAETPEPPATPATPEPAIKKEEAKKNKGEKVRGFGKMFKKKAEPPAEPVESVQEKEISNDELTDVSVPDGSATDPQPESGSIGEEAAVTIVAERRRDFNLHQKAEISTQTDTKTEADISTQTGGDDDTGVNTQSLVEEVVVETAATEGEQQLNESVVMAEEVFEETAGEEPRGDQTAEISAEEVVLMGNDVYENIVFRAEQVEITDDFEISHIKTDAPEMPEISAEPNKSLTECEIVTEDDNVDESVPLEFSLSLPKVVADCVKAVFAADSDSADFAAVNTSQPRVDEVITEDNIEGAREVSADVVVIKVAEPEYNAVTPEAGEANGLPSLDETPVTTVAEAITEAVCEEPNPTSANQVEELSEPVATEILVEEESVHEEVNAEDAVDVKDVSEEEAPSNELITIEELLEDTLNSPDNEVKLECILEVIAADETVKVGEDVIVHEGTAEEAEPGPAIVIDKTEVILEAAIDVLSQEFSVITPRDPAMDNDIALEEEMIVATCFIPLSGEQDASFTISEEPSETTAEELNEALEALSNDFEAVLGSVEDDTTVLESSTGGEVTSSSDPVEIKTKASDDVLLVTGESQPRASVQEELVEDNVAPSVVAVEEPTDPSPVISEEPVEQSASLLESQMLVLIIETTEDEVTEEIIHETDNSGDVSATVDINSKDSEAVTSDEALAECAEDVFETIVEEIIMEDITAECNAVTTVEEAPWIIENSEDSDIADSDQNVADRVKAVLETIVEEIVTEDVETEFNRVTSDKEAPELTEGENESLVNTTDSSQSAETILSTDMNNLLDRLQSACTSVVVDSAYSLGGFKMSSMGYTITVTIHVAPNKEQQ